MNSNDSTRNKSNTSTRLSTRISWLVFSFTAVLSIISIGLQSALFYQQKKKEAETVLIDVEQSFLPSLEKSLWSVDQEQTQILLDGILELHDVGKVILEEKGQASISIQNEDIGNLFNAHSYALDYTVNGRNFKLGSLQVFLTDVYIKEALIQNIWLMMLSTVLTLFIVAIMIIQVFKNMVSRHLVKMQSYALELDTKGLNQSLRLDRNPNIKRDELDEVVDAINSMRLRIRNHIEAQKQNEAELELYKNDLERVVDQRTEELKLKSDMLESKTAELAEQNQELDAYAHTVAHDLKQPVNSLIGLVNVLEESKKTIDTALLNETLGMISSSASKMQQIIESLLTLSVIRKSEIVDLEAIDSKKVALQAINRLQDSIKKHSAEVVLDEDVSWPLVMGKYQWIEEVWVNYLTNAFKYGGRPPYVVIKCRTINGKARFEVTDNGHGIDIQKEQVLYQAFNRLHGAMYEGHGLGLSIVKRIMDKLNGQVGFEAAPGGGTTFWFTLPIA